MKLSNLAIVKLMQVKGVGRAKIFKLEKMLSFVPTSNEDLSDIVMENATDLKLLIANKFELLDAFKKGEELFEQSLNKGIKMIAYGDRQYPKLLESIDAPPVILNILGNIDDLLVKPGVAVIGTRQPSAFGRQIGERIGFRLGERNINVISGLAIGCDSAGHIGCLKAKGMTTAILAHGLDTVYPKENTKLAEEILDNNGCLLSEYMIKTRSLANFFVERDRIQAGLSQATFVIETDVKGGTMHAVNATIQNKRILAVYNHPLDKQTEKSRGNQLLIQQRKAKGIQTKEDIEAFINSVIPALQDDNSLAALAEEERLNSDGKAQIDLEDNSEKTEVPSIAEAEVTSTAETEKIVNEAQETSNEPFALEPPPPKLKKARKKKS